MVGFKIKDSLQTKFLIAKTGNTLKSFTSEVGISYAYMSRIITGKTNPSPTVASKIATALGKNIEDLFIIQTSEKQEVTQ